MSSGRRDRCVNIFHVKTKEMKELPLPRYSSSAQWPGPIPKIPEPPFTSADEILSLLHEHVARFTTAFHIYHRNEKLEEKPEEDTWTIFLKR